MILVFSCLIVNYFVQDMLPYKTILRLLNIKAILLPVNAPINEFDVAPDLLARL